MAAGEITVTGTIVSNIHDTGAGVYGAVHNPYTTALSLGQASKGAVFSFGYWNFSNWTGPGLPPNSKITNAFMRMTANAVQAGALYDVYFRCLKRDGKWNKEDCDCWTAFVYNDFRMEVYDTSSTNKLTTLLVGALDTVYGLRTTADKGKKLGQTWWNNTGSTYVLGSMKMHLRKVGAPTGEIGLELYQGHPNTNIDFYHGGWDSPLAVSSGIDVSTVPGGTGGDVEFTFHGANQRTISDTYFLRNYVTVITGTYTESLFNYVGVNSDISGGYAGGHALISGTGHWFDTQNYPEQHLLPWTGAAGNELGSAVTWTTVGMAPGDTYETDDLSLIIQEAVNDPGGFWDSGYADDLNIGLNWDAQDALAGQLCYIAMYEHATRDPCELVVTYKPRRAFVT